MLPKEGPMNRNRRSMPNQTRKAVEKEIKKGQKKLAEKEDVPRTDTLTPLQALKKYPKKIQKTEKPVLASTVKKMEVKKKKKTAKHSRRTTPGEVEHRESPPAHIHPEGQRWEKTLVQQSKKQRKVLTSKLQKRKK